MGLSALPSGGVAVIIVLSSTGFAAIHRPGEEDEERSDWLQRKWLGILVMGDSLVSLGVTVAATFEWTWHDSGCRKWSSHSTQWQDRK